VAGAQQVEALLAALQVETVDFTQDALPHFVAGAERHHHKVDVKARLNLGDLFTYALAKETALPLFFQGTDFANTAIENAMALLGYVYSDKGVPQHSSDRQD
jgi:ribonuclease VapC